MTTTDASTGENDFYTQLTAEIEAGNTDQAVVMVGTLPERASRIEVLARLARTLGPALDIRGASTLDLNRARALLRARDRANELVAALDPTRDLDHRRALEPALESSQALNLAIERARALYLYLDRADQINRTIMGCLNELLDTVHASTTTLPRVVLPSPANKSGRLIMIAVVCVVLVVGVIMLMVMQSQSRARSAAATTTAQAVQQTAATVTPYVTLAVPQQSG